jgi:hypothetical protein
MQYLVAGILFVEHGARVELSIATTLALMASEGCHLLYLRWLLLGQSASERTGVVDGAGGGLGDSRLVGSLAKLETAKPGSRMETSPSAWASIQVGLLASRPVRSRSRGSTSPPKSVVNTNPLSVHRTWMQTAGPAQASERVLGHFPGPFLAGVATSAWAMLHFYIA